MPWGWHGGSERSGPGLLFDKPVYAVFLALVVSVYWRLPQRGRNAFLLGASYFFYAWWDWRFLCLMAACTLVDYLLAARISRSRHPSEKRAYLALSLIVNFGVLGFFK